MRFTFYRIIVNRRETFAFILEYFSKIIPARVLFKILKIKFEMCRYFKFKEEQLEYFIHSYNNTRMCERSIEIPIIADYLKKYRIRKVLEIGNVTNHYYTFFQNLYDSKTVIDKYEKGYGVVNKDIKDYISEERYEFIFSVSTFEHMDSDNGNNPEYIKGGSKYLTYAADNILHVCKNLLKEGGVFVITAPLSQRDEWNKTIFSKNVMDCDFLGVKSINMFFFKKTSELNWIEVDIEEAKKIKYNYPWPRVNALSIVEIKK